MISFSTVKTITLKELRHFIDHPTAYIALVVFLLLWEWLFFRSAFLIGEASLRGMFTILPWLLLLLVPALTMGSVADERGQGTIEFVLSHPVRDIEFILGKFLGAQIFISIALLFIVPLAISFASFGQLDWGIVFAQYLAGFLLSAILISLGIFISSLFVSQISALLVTVASAFLLLIAGFSLVTSRLPVYVGNFLQKLSAFSHFQSMVRGVLDVRDVVYVISAIIVFLSLAYLWLRKRRFGDRRIGYRKLQLGVAITIVLALSLNLVGSYIPGRIDLTEGKLYTLTSATKQTLANLQEPVRINLYVSSNLPTPMQTTLRDTNDILADYEIFGRANIIVERKDPNTDPETIVETQQFGVPEVQFNVVGNEEVQLKKGYFGMVIGLEPNEGEKPSDSAHETIPFIQSTGNLEYQITSAIMKLTRAETPIVRFLDVAGSHDPYKDYSVFLEDLRKEFTIETLPYSADSEEPFAIADDTSVLVLAGPKIAVPSDALKAVKEYLKNGGAALFLVDGVEVQQEIMYAVATEHGLNNLLGEYGIAVQSDLVYDLESNENVQISGGFLQYVIPYPLWPRVMPAEPITPITSKIRSVILPWMSSLSIDQEKMAERGFSAVPFLTTTSSIGFQTEEFSITPNTQFANQNAGPVIVAYGFMPTDSAATEGRFAVISDSDFLEDQFTRGNPDNAVFGSGLISWLAEEESLATLKLKERAGGQLKFENSTQLNMVKFGNLAFAVLLPLILGAARLFRRRHLKRFSYSSRL